VRSEEGITLRQITKGCGQRHQLHGDVWGEAPVANVFFCFIWLNETHSRTHMRIIGDS